MHRTAAVAFLLSLAMLWGCSSPQTVLVSVPPRMDLKSYGTLGLVEFASNADSAINARATREFLSHVHSAQPGTRIVELGSREAALAAVGARQLDADALRRIGEKYGVDALILGEIAYSEPKTEVKIGDLSKLEGGVRTEVRGDMSAKVVETRSGASVWSASSWARRQVGRVNVSGDQGVSGALRNADPREEMLPSLLSNLTQDFRPGTVRQQVK